MIKKEDASPTPKYHPNRQKKAQRLLAPVFQTASLRLGGKQNIAAPIQETNLQLKDYEPKFTIFAKNG